MAGMRFKLPTMQGVIDFAILWIVMVAIIKYVPLPTQLKAFIVPKV